MEKIKYFSVSIILNPFYRHSINKTGRLMNLMDFAYKSGFKISNFFLSQPKSKDDYPGFRSKFTPFFPTTDNSYIYLKHRRIFFFISHFGGTCVELEDLHGLGCDYFLSWLASMMCPWLPCRGKPEGREGLFLPRHHLRGWHSFHHMAGSW